MIHSFISTFRSIVRRVLRNQWGFRLIGIGVFVLILLKIDLGEVLRVLTTVGLATGTVYPFESTSASEMLDPVAPYLITAAYPMWRSSVYPPEAIPLDYVHQISHSFVLPGEEGALAVPDDFLMPQLIELVHAANKKIGLGVGGASSHDEFAPALTPRAGISNSALLFLPVNGLASGSTSRPSRRWWTIIRL
jgi:hypothetical protein